MILKQLKIYGYGKWLNKTFDLSSGLQVFYGPNEAGKSTLIDFIMSILFGFLNKRQAIHGQYIPKNHQDMYGGELWFELDNTNYRLIRTKGPKGGVVRFFNVDQQVELDESQYESLISPIDRQTYQQLFYFNGEDQEVAYRLNATELKTRIQQIGVANADDWVALQDKLDRTAHDLYAERGRKPEINRQLQKYDLLKQQVVAAQADYPRYEALSRNLNEIKAQLKSLQTQLATQQQKQQKQQKMLSVVPLIEKYHQLSAIDQSSLREGFERTDLERYDQLSSAVKVQQEQVTRQRQQLQAEQHSTGIPAEIQFYQQNQDLIDRLIDQAPAVKGTVAQLDFLQKRLHDSRLKSQNLRAQLSLGPGQNQPNPFSDSDYAKVVSLLTKENQSQASEATSQSELPHSRTQARSQRQRSGFLDSRLYFVIAGIIIVIGLLFHGSVLSWLGYLLAALIAGFGVVQSRNTQSSTNEGVQATRSYSNGQDSENNADLEKIRVQYQLADIPMSRWLQIQPVLQNIVTLERDQDSLASQISDQQAELNNYVQQWRFAEKWLPLRAEDDRGNLEIIIRQASDWQSRSNQLNLSGNHQEIYQKLLSEGLAKLSALQNEQQTFLSHRHVDSEAAFMEGIQSQQNLRDQLNQKAELATRIRALGGSIYDQIDQRTVQAELTSIENQMALLNRQLSELSQKEAALQIKMADLVKNGHYFDLKQQLVNQESEILKNVHYYLALSLTRIWIQRVLDIATKGRLPKAIELAQRYFASLTGQQYHEISFDKKIQVTRKDGEQFDINELSKGTLEQLYVSLVFSMTVGFSDEYPMPLIIDDGFMSFDSDRKRAAYQIMQDISKHTQVLYFTAINDQPKLGTADQIDLSRV